MRMTVFGEEDRHTVKSLLLTFIGFLCLAIFLIVIAVLVA
jgi:hypothetical protein